MGQMSPLSGHAYWPPAPGGSLPAVHQEQLNTTHGGVHWRKQAVKKGDTHTQATLKDGAGNATAPEAEVVPSQVHVQEQK